MKRPTLHPALCRRIGFGCGRLVGGTSFKESAQLLETAAELGIRYFDVAPSYGLGSAERVLGEVLGGDTQFEIATKVGISRPKNATLLSAARSIVAPMVRKVEPLKRLALSILSRQSNRHEMNSNELLASFEESLHFLKRDAVDVLFLHEAIGIDIPETRKFFEQMHQAQKCRYFGAAISAQKTDIQFGNAVQLGFGRNLEIPDSFEKVNVHGVLRESIIESDNVNFNLLNLKHETVVSALSAREFESAMKLYNSFSVCGISKVLVSFKSVDSMRNVLFAVSELLEIEN